MTPAQQKIQRVNEAFTETIRQFNEDIVPYLHGFPNNLQFRQLRELERRCIKLYEASAKGAALVPSPNFMENFVQSEMDNHLEIPEEMREHFKGHMRGVTTTYFSGFQDMKRLGWQYGAASRSLCYQIILSLRVGTATALYRYYHRQMKSLRVEAVGVPCTIGVGILALNSHAGPLYFLLCAMPVALMMHFVKVSYLIGGIRIALDVLIRKNKRTAIKMNKWSLSSQNPE